MSDRLSALRRLAASVRSDRELLSAFLAGEEPGAFDELNYRYTGLARRAAAEVCPAVADDVAQATLALMSRKASVIADRESAAGWVFETARRLALKARVAATRRARRERKAKVSGPPADPLDTLTLREVRAAVAEELARLPDELRLPLVLCYWDGATKPAAAARLACSLSTLKRRLNDGRDRLAARLARRGFAGPLVLAALTAVQAGANAALPMAAPIAPGVARWKVVSSVVLAASVAAVGIGICLSTPVAADPPGQAGRSDTPPAVERPGPPLDRYGDPLPAGALARLGTVRFRHGGQVHSVAFSPDGKIIASGGFGRIMLWEAETGKPLGPLVRKLHPPGAPGKPPEPRVEHGHTFGLAFTSDGKQLISVGSPTVDRRTGNYVFWDVEGRKQGIDTLYSDAGGTHWLRAVALAPGDKKVAFATDSGKIYLMDTKSHADLWQTRTDGAGGLAISPNGKIVAVANYARALLLDAADGRELKRLESGKARQVVFAPDSESVWVGCDGGGVSDREKFPGTVSRWDLQTGTKAQSFEMAPGMLLSLALSPDGKMLAAGGENYGPLLWEAAGGKPAELESHGQRRRPWLQNLAFSPDGKSLAAADTSGRVRVWDVTTRRERVRHDEHSGGLPDVAVSPDGKLAATAGADGTVRIWDLATMRTVRSWSADNFASVLAVAFTPDGGSLLTCGWSGSLRLWDVATGKEIRRLRDEKSYVRGAALSPDGQLVATTGKGGMSIVLCETATGRPVRELTGHISLLSWLTFSPDGRRLISAADSHFDGTKSLTDLSVRVWDVATGKELHKFDAGRPHGGVAVSPDGRVIAAGAFAPGETTGSLRFWDTVTGKELEERRMNGVARVAFSKDGRYLATADRDIQLIEVASGRPVQNFQSEAGAVNKLVFTPDGRRLISAHDDGTALVWDLVPQGSQTTDRAKLWEELASEDAAAARRAAGALVADPGAVAVLSEKLIPVPKPAGARTTAALISSLDHKAFTVREAASHELLRRAAVDFEELTAALEKASSPEVRQRLNEILRSAPSPWPRLDAADLGRVRAVGVLEAIGTTEARRLLTSLANGDPYARLTAEARAAGARLP
jgi:WD40 repeat protein/DNA-directed RNA polymerase specialized sigma24 family protein